MSSTVDNSKTGRRDTGSKFSPEVERAVKHFQSHHTNNSEHWVAYVQPTGKNELGAEECKLAMMSPDGKTLLTYVGASGGRTGHDTLPGLDGDKDLNRTSENTKLPVTVYEFGRLEIRDPHDPVHGKYFANDKGHAYFLPINNKDVVRGHGDYGVHPNDETKWADRSLGCVGLHNEDSERFLHDFSKLQEQGIAPQKLEVYSKDQDPQQLLADRGYSTKLGKETAPDLIYILEHSHSPTPASTPAVQKKEKAATIPHK